ncbi:hypothetical protein D9M68_714800 [compost metagenome]
MERLTDLYENNNPLLPFIVWGLNAVGLGVVDRLLCKRAADFTTKRLENLIIELGKYIDKRISEPQSENFMPALQQCLPSLLQTQSTEKAKHFAKILAETWNNVDSRWDEVSQTLRLIRQLEDVHIFILRKALELNTSPTGQVTTFTVGQSGYAFSVRLDELLPNIDPMLLTSCVSDLVAMGLIRDSFAIDGGTWGDADDSTPKSSPLTYAISDLGRWLLERIADHS